MPHPSLTIIVPHYNTPDSLQNLLELLGTAFPIIVVDNASKHVPKVAKHVHLISNSQNQGFSHACNQGAVEAQTEWLLFLNPDISITPEQIENLVREATTSHLVAASPQLIDSIGAVQWSYHRARVGFTEITREYTLLKRFSPTMHSLHQQTVLPGGCLLIQRAALKSVGGWDERFWLWWEDVDLSERLYCANHKIGVLPKIQVQHAGGESFSPLTETWRRAVFFHSLRIYAREHFDAISARLTQILTYRFSPDILYPGDEDIRASIIVPNVKPEILGTFLEQNLTTITSADELIVVMGQSDVHRFRKAYPQVVFIGLKTNHGFASTVNIGFRRARGKYLITVNDDTILQDEWIDTLLDQVKKDTGSVSPLVVSPSQAIESLGIYALPQGKAVALQPNDDRQPNAFNAAAVLLTRNALEKVGLFDERFGSYLEDIDLGLRMTRAGFQHVVAPKVKVVHLRHQTSKSNPRRKAWQDVRNWWFVVLKNTSLLSWMAYGPGIIVERLRNISGYIKTYR